MNAIVQYNRDTLNTVPQWIKREDYNNSIFKYGLPERLFHLIDKNISNELTECDIICYLMSLFHQDGKKITYLELGVSVGKTFYQIINYVKNNLKAEYSINCLDIEQINPTLRHLLDSIEFTLTSEINIPVNLSVPSDIIRSKDTNTILTFANGTNDITYYESDEFDNNIWKNMNKQYNFIFSDAFHEPNALLTEYNRLKDNNLIDFNKFIYCFDDLGDAPDNCLMWQAVISIYNDLKNITGQTLQLKHHSVNGWIGNNEHKHNFGVISNFDYTIII